MKACPLMLEARFLWASFTGSSRHGSEEELDKNDPFLEFIDVPKHPQKDEDEKISDEHENEENEDDESAYYSDDDED